MKKGLNSTAIITVVIAVCLVAVIGTLGFKASKSKNLTANPDGNADSITVDDNTVTQAEETFDYYTTTIPDSSSDFLVSTSEPTTTSKLSSAVSQVQEKITSAISAVTSEVTIKVAGSTLDAVVIEGATVPVVEDTSKSQGTSVSSVASATANTDLPKDMYFSGLYNKGFDTIGPKGFIYNDDTSPNCTQRKFGYNSLYDVGASLIDFSIQTAKFDFNYDNKSYRIQLWKGQYISGDIGTVGGEVGIYTRSPGKTYVGSHYDCAAENDWLYMELTVLWDEFDDGVYRAQLTRKYALHWWETGYVDGQLKNRNDSSTLRLLSRITFKDEEQAKAFTNALVGQGMTCVKDFDPTVKDTCKRSGKDVIYVWQDAGIK